IDAYFDPFQTLSTTEKSFNKIFKKYQCLKELYNKLGNKNVKAIQSGGAFLRFQSNGSRAIAHLSPLSLKHYFDLFNHLLLDRRRGIDLHLATKFNPTGVLQLGVSFFKAVQSEERKDGCKVGTKSGN